MKTNILFLFILFFFSTSVLAQDTTSTATRQIGLTGVPISYVSSGGFKGIHLYGNIGRIIKDYSVVGLKPFFELRRLGGVFDNGERLHSLGANVYYRRYLSRNRWSFFLEANAGFGYLWNTSKSSVPDPLLRENNGIIFNYGFGPGVDFEIKNGWNIELNVQYQRGRNFSNPETKIGGRGIVPTIGLQRFF